MRVNMPQKRDSAGLQRLPIEIFEYNMGDRVAPRTWSFSTIRVLPGPFLVPFIWPWTRRAYCF